MLSEENLIFIISQPRSGSTFLQKLISNNKEVATASEPWILLPFSIFYKQKLFKAKFNECVAFKAFDDYLNKFDQRIIFDQKLKRYILSLYEKPLGDKKFFLDKTPRYYEIIPLISTWFPKAKIIVLKRNPFAALHSMIKTWGGGKVNYENLLSYERDFLTAPRLLQAFLEKNQLNDNIYEIKYEDIVRSPDSSIQKIYQWMDITYSPEVLNFANNIQARGIFGDDVYKVEREESYKGVPSIKSLDKWKRQLKKKSFKDFIGGYSNYLGSDFLKKYGYTSLDKEFTYNEKPFKKFIQLKEHPEFINFSLKKYLKYKYY